MKRKICLFCQHDNPEILATCNGCGASLTFVELNILADNRQLAKGHQVQPAHRPHVINVPLDMDNIKPTKLYHTATGIHMYSGDEWVYSVNHEDWKELNS
jgi:hypothetical protein